MISVTCISANKLLIDNLTSWTLSWWVHFIFVINPRVDFLGFVSLDIALWSFEDKAQFLYQSPPTWWIQSVSFALNSRWNTDSSLAAFCLLLPHSGLLEISSWYAQFIGQLRGEVSLYRAFSSLHCLSLLFRSLTFHMHWQFQLLWPRHQCGWHLLLGSSSPTCRRVPRGGVLHTCRVPTVWSPLWESEWTPDSEGFRLPFSVFQQFF